MDETIVNLLVASLGVTGTLAAALLTQVLASKAEAQRRLREDQSRWLNDRLRVNTRFLASSLSLERDLWSAAAQLDRDDRPVRMPGNTTILLTPEEGIPGVFDKITRSILVEAVEDAFERLDVLEELAAEITLLGTAEEVAAARALHEALWDVAGGMEAYRAFDEVADAVERARAARDDFARAARAGMRHGEEVEAMDRRPRRVDDRSNSTD